MSQCGNDNYEVIVVHGNTAGKEERRTAELELARSALRGSSKKYVS